MGSIPSTKYSTYIHAAGASQHPHSLGGECGRIRQLNGSSCSRWCIDKSRRIIRSHHTGYGFIAVCRETAGPSRECRDHAAVRRTVRVLPTYSSDRRRVGLRLAGATKLNINMNARGYPTGGGGGVGGGWGGTKSTWCTSYMRAAGGVPSSSRRPHAPPIRAPAHATYTPAR
jgi:hypothetical protein